MSINYTHDLEEQNAVIRQDLEDSRTINNSIKGLVASYILHMEFEESRIRLKIINYCEAKAGLAGGDAFNNAGSEKSNNNVSSNNVIDKRTRSLRADLEILTSNIKYAREELEKWTNT